MRLVLFVKNLTGFSYEASQWLTIGFIAVLVAAPFVIWGYRRHRRNKTEPHRVSYKQAAQLIGLVMGGKITEAKVYWKQIGCPTSQQVHWGEHLPGDYHGNGRMSRAMVDFFKEVLPKEGAASAPTVAAVSTESSSPVPAAASA